MSDLKITELPQLTTPTKDDLLAIVNASVTKKIAVSDFLKIISSGLDTNFFVVPAGQQAPDGEYYFNITTSSAAPVQEGEFLNATPLPEHVISKTRTEHASVIPPLVPWSNFPLAPSTAATDIVYANTFQGVATTSDGKIFLTTDAGNTWAKVYDNSDANSIVSIEKNAYLPVNAGGIDTGGIDVTEAFSIEFTDITDVVFDLSVTGGGFLTIVPSSGPNKYTTQNTFKLDSSFRIVTLDGDPIIGSSGILTWDVDCVVAPTSNKIVIMSDGRIYVRIAGSSGYSLSCIIGVTTFTTPSALAYDGNNYFTSTTDSGSGTIGGPATLSSTIILNNPSTLDERLKFNAVGGTSLYRSEDSGATWAALSASTGLLSGETYIGVSSSKKALYLLGSKGTLVTGAFDPTNSPSFISFAVVSNLPTGTYTGLKVFDNPDVNDGSIIYATGYVTGSPERGILYKSLDLGATWTQLLNLTNISFRNLCFVNPHEGWLVGETSGNPYIYSTHDGGVTWAAASLSSYSGATLKGVFVMPAVINGFETWRGWAVADNNVILKTTDGATWSKSPTIANGYILNAVFALTDSDDFVLAGEIPASLSTPPQAAIYSYNTNVINGVTYTYTPVDTLWTGILNLNTDSTVRTGYLCALGHNSDISSATYDAWMAELLTLIH